MHCKHLLTCLVVSVFESHFVSSPNPSHQSRDKHRSTDGVSATCVFEDHLVTDKNWYGYLANVTSKTAGGMAFDFVFPARLCCINVLFYDSEQASLVRLNSKCWEKEGLVRQEDQILRLTPKFSWSGCHVTTMDGIEAYTCKSGRSFNKENTTWYIAVSNCDTIFGLNLKYRIEVFGHSGPCKTTLPSSTTFLDQLPLIVPPRAPPRAHHVHRETILPRITMTENLSLDEVQWSIKEVDDDDVTNGRACLIEGVLNITNSNWFSFLGNFTLKPGGGFKFWFSYPLHMQVQNVIIYFEEDLPRLFKLDDCWEKEGVLKSHQVTEQILDLSPRASWNGCTSGDHDPHLILTPLILQTPQWPGHAWFGVNLTCHGRKHFETRRTVHLTVSNCRSQNGLLLDYKFQVFGFESYDGRTDSCSAASTHSGVLGVVVAMLLLPLKWR